MKFTTASWNCFVCMSVGFIGATGPPLANAAAVSGVTKFFVMARNTTPSGRDGSSLANFSKIFARMLTRANSVSGFINSALGT